MFGEEVEDKLEEKVILASENPAPLLEEIKQIAAEEDEKQPSEPNPDEHQLKNSEDVVIELKDEVNYLFHRVYI